jgi:hypothetical protein
MNIMSSLSSSNDNHFRHVTAVNLARRYTVQNEPDLMMVRLPSSIFSSTFEI